MKIFRTAASGVTGFFLRSNSSELRRRLSRGFATMPPTLASIGLNPTSVIAGSEIFTLTRSCGIYSDFHNNKTDEFNSSFVKQTTSPSAFTFVDPAIPAGYAPPGIQAAAGIGG